MTGFVSIVGAGPGDPELITLRGRRVLDAADVILYDELAGRELLDGVRAERIYVGKQRGLHAMEQDEIGRKLVELARAGKRVVRLKGGDPFVFGRGGEEAEVLRDAGIPFEIVPGVSSSTAAPLAAGIPVTHRGVADGFCVITAHRRSDAGDFAIPPWDPRRTVVLLMGVESLPIWSKQMRDSGYPDSVPVAFVMDATRQSQRVICTSLGRCEEDAASGGLRSPAVSIVGEVVGLMEKIRGR